jgi:hypothetical protein
MSSSRNRAGLLGERSLMSPVCRVIEKGVMANDSRRSTLRIPVSSRQERLHLGHCSTIVIEQLLRRLIPEGLSPQLGLPKPEVPLAISNLPASTWARSPA